MSDVRRLAIDAVALRVLGDKVKERSEAVRVELAAALDPGDRKTAALDDGTVVGSVGYTKGRTSARVTDHVALLAWVQANYPGEIEPGIRPAFVTAILDATKRAGLPMTPDGTLDVPGVAVVRGEPYLAVTADPLGLPALLDAVRANQALALDGGE